MALTNRPFFGGSTSRTSSRNVVEFKAGKMQMTGNMVHADKRKGLVYIYQSDDMLMHLCWKDRNSGEVEIDLVIFPDDVEYKKVAQCTTGRVYVLNFKSTNRKYFFWMQEPKTDKDDDLCQKVNDTLNNPPTNGTRDSASSGLSASLPPELSSLGDGELHSLLANMNHHQLMQLLGVPGLAGLLGNSSLGTTPARITSRVSSNQSTTSGSLSSISVSTAANNSSAANTTTTVSGSGTENRPQTANIQLSDLQSILSGISAVNPSSTQSVDLSPALTAEALKPILSNTEFVEQLKEYLPQISELKSMPSADQLKGTIQSPQFQQAVTTFSAALESGQLGPLIQQFNLGDDAVKAAEKGDMEGFVKALQKKEAEKEDEGMALD